VNEQPHDGIPMTPAAPAPVAEAPDPASLVPLEDLAPAIVTVSRSRRAFLGFGLALTGGLAGAAALTRFFPVFGDDAPPASPIVTSYDPTRRQWVFVVDTATCIGCGYCVVACPYGARYLVPAGEHEEGITPGIADKCTWCYPRINQGQLPACVEICPVGARKFGDASDPSSEIASVVRDRNPQMLHPEYGTNPRVLYLGPSVQEA
jgi:ferredoxin